jgi:hypothetical protein
MVAHAARWSWRSALARAHDRYRLAGALRPKLRERDVDDIIHALTSPEVYRLLVCDRGWPPERYERWLKDILIDQLLPPAATGSDETES